MAEVFLMKLSLHECHRTLLKSILAPVMAWWRQQELITWSNVDPDPCLHLASPGSNELPYGGFNENGRHFANGIFKSIFIKRKHFHFDQNFTNVSSRVSKAYMLALILVVSWHQANDTPSPELTHISETICHMTSLGLNESNPLAVTSVTPNPYITRTGRFCALLAVVPIVASILVWAKWCTWCQMLRKAFHYNDVKITPFNLNHAAYIIVY